MGKLSIKKNYLKTQVDALKLYTQWAKPYLRAAQKLGMKEFKTKAGLPSPELVAAFNNMVMNLKLLGKKEIKPEGVHPAYKKVSLENKYFSCLEIEFQYRTLPKIMGQGQYVQTGLIDVFFRSYVFTDEDLKDIETYEALQDLDLVNNLTEGSLKRLHDDIDYYLSEKKEEKKIEKKSFSWPLGNMFKGFQSHVNEPMKEAGKGFFETIRPPNFKTNISFLEGQVRKAAQEKSLGNALVIYDVFKKAHRMATW